MLLPAFLEGNMRRLIASLFAMAALGFGSAFAQDAFGATVSLGPDYYAGASVGAGLPGGASFNLHFGMSNLLTQGVGVRFSAGYARAFALGADIIANLPVNTGDAPLGIYAGGGLGLAFTRDTSVGIGLFAGAEYRLVNAGMPESGIFFEMGPAFSIAGNRGASFNLKAGFNYHF
jgi:hypothetical protein